MELTKTTRSKPSLILDGYSYRLHRKTDHYLHLLCVKEMSTGAVTNSLMYSIRFHLTFNILELKIQTFAILYRLAFNRATLARV